MDALATALPHALLALLLVVSTMADHFVKWFIKSTRPAFQPAWVDEIANIVAFLGAFNVSMLTLLLNATTFASTVSTSGSSLIKAMNLGSFAWSVVLLYGIVFWCLPNYEAFRNQAVVRGFVIALVIAPNIVLASLPFFSP